MNLKFQSWRLVAGPLPLQCWPGFDIGPVHAFFFFAGQSGSGAFFFLLRSISVFPCRYHSTSAPYSSPSTWCTYQLFFLKPNTCLLTYSMVQSPSWAANWFAASQEIPRISRNPKVHYRTHMRPPPVTILGQPNPVHIPTSHLLEIHPNIIHPSTPRSPHWSPSLRFPYQDLIHPPLLTHTCHMPSPSHSFRFYHQHT